jgi:wyosine [tRNA(Phe)-imidazoG37] synthetase (radical SAM superfamily)
MSSKPKIPSAVYADAEGRILDLPAQEMAALSGEDLVCPEEEELSPLPGGSKFFFLPGGRAVGWDPGSGRFSAAGDGLTAVAAFPAPGYTRTLLPAAEFPESRMPLPLWAYTAVGWREEKFVAAAVRVDESRKQDPERYDDRELDILVKQRLAEDPESRLLGHIAHCATEYHCFAAKNLFYGRWEAPLPTTALCNADCVGCISLQPDGHVPASHNRISFIPTAGEIAGLAVSHLSEAEDAIVSFGQGCDGDPLVQAPLLREAIECIRSETGRGTIHLNTNGSLPDAVADLARAGLDSIRVSLNSARDEVYTPYYRPKDYRFADVRESIRRAVAEGLFVSLNYLVFPGVTDRVEEVEALEDLIEETGLHMVQAKNLCIDPQFYLKTIPPAREETIGIVAFLDWLRERFPSLDVGYFNRPKKEFPFVRGDE